MKKSVFIYPSGSYSAHAELLDPLGVELDAEARGVGHGDPARLGADDLGDGLSQRGPLLDDEFQQAEGVGDAGQEVEGSSDVQVGGETVVDDRNAPVGRHRGDLHSFGEAAAAGQVHLEDV